MNKWKKWMKNLGLAVWMEPVFGRGIDKMGGIDNVIKNSKIIISETSEFLSMYYLIDKDSIVSVPNMGFCERMADNKLSLLHLRNFLSKN